MGGQKNKPPGITGGQPYDRPDAQPDMQLFRTAQIYYRFPLSPF